MCPEGFPLKTLRWQPVLPGIWSSELHVEQRKAGVGEGWGGGHVTSVSESHSCHRTDSCSESRGTITPGLSSLFLWSFFLITLFYVPRCLERKQATERLGMRACMCASVYRHVCYRVLSSVHTERSYDKGL